MQDIQQIVTLQSILSSSQWQNSSAKLPLAIGKDENGEAVVLDLARMPHLLISGLTGSGKTACMESIIMSLLSKFFHNELRLILADLKAVVFHLYKGLPYLHFPVIESPEETLTALLWCAEETERRYQVMKDAQCKTVYEYNSLGLLPMPYVVFLIDEFADLMFINTDFGNTVKNVVRKICAKGEAAGIHLIISSVRADSKVLPLEILAGFPARIAFKLYSADNSCLILGRPGAEKLKRCGDMLMQLPSSDNLLHCQCAFADEKMIKAFIDTLGPHKPETPGIDPLNLPVVNIESLAEEIKKFIRPGDTQGFLQTLKLVIANPSKACTSYLQLNLNIGYNRAAVYMDLLRERGVIKKLNIKF